MGTVGDWRDALFSLLFRVDDREEGVIGGDRSEVPEEEGEEVLACWGSGR